MKARRSPVLGSSCRQKPRYGCGFQLWRPQQICILAACMLDLEISSGLEQGEGSRGTRRRPPFLPTALAGSWSAALPVALIFTAFHPSPCHAAASNMAQRPANAWGPESV